MAQSLVLAGGIDPASSQGPIARRSDDPRRGAETGSTEQDLARFFRVNLFTVGGDEATAQLVASLWAHLATPVVVRHRGEPLRLPPTSQRVGTIVLYGVETLTSQEQHTLNEWLCARRGGTRVVSTASQSLLPLMEAGAFSDALYYRLNVVTLDLTATTAE